MGYKKITRIELDNKKQKFKINIQNQQISDNESLKVVSCLNHLDLDGSMDFSKRSERAQNTYTTIGKKVTISRFLLTQYYENRNEKYICLNIN